MPPVPAVTKTLWQAHTQASLYQFTKLLLFTI